MPVFNQSDHVAVFLILKYKQSMLQEAVYEDEMCMKLPIEFIINYQFCLLLFSEER